MRALVTGGTGFVGGHLVRELRSRGDDVVVAGESRGADVDLALDLHDARSVARAVEAAGADVVYHLAAQASVANATSAPLQTYAVNVMGTAFVVEAARAQHPMPRVLFVSSAEVYGAQDRAAMPLCESATLRPVTVYAASKVAGEAIVLAASRTFGLPSSIVRTFNLIGPGQSDRFVVGAFVARLAAIAAGGPPQFPVGNLTAQRDFLDVRDAVRAYADLGAADASLWTGEIFNVCRGVPTSVQEILRQLVLAAGIPVEIREDSALLRPVDVPLVYGNANKLRDGTGWAPTLSLAHTLRDAYAWALRSAEVVGASRAKDPRGG